MYGEFISLSYFYSCCRIQQWPQHLPSYYFGCFCQYETFIIKIGAERTSKDFSNIGIKGQQNFPSVSIRFHSWEMGQNSILQSSAMNSSLPVQTKFFQTLAIESDNLKTNFRTRASRRNDDTR